MTILLLEPFLVIPMNCHPTGVEGPAVPLTPRGVSAGGAWG